MSGFPTSASKGQIPFIPGLWYPADASTVAAFTLIQASAYATPYVSSDTHTYQGIGASIQAAGAAGALARFGIYTDANGYPGTLITDFGTTSSAVSTPISIAAAIPLTAGVKYWLVVAAQGAPVTQANIFANNSRTSLFMGQTTPVGGPTGFIVSGVAAALPNPFPLGGTENAFNQPIVQLQA